MINFKNFLFKRTGRIEIITEDKVIKLLSKYSEEELNEIFSGPRFYRGDNKAFAYGICRPTKLDKRVSPNVYNNYYNLFLSNDETWKEYPPREYSIIGSTDLDSISNYDNLVYICIPLSKQANIGIAPNYDLFKSFKTLDKLKFNSLNSFFYEVNKCIDSPDSITDYNTLKKELEKPEFLINTKKSDSKEMIKAFEKSVNAFKTIQELLDPKNNDFKHMTYNNFIRGTFDDNEVWTSDDVIMINTYYIKNIKSKLGI